MDVWPITAGERANPQPLRFDWIAQHDGAPRTSLDDGTGFNLE
jgi:hypothetical protein